MLFGITKCLGQTDTLKTEIILLGIIHTGNKKFNFKTLYRTIKTNSPDIILWEQNEPFKRVFGLMTAYRLKIAKPIIEQLALQKLTRKDKKKVILGFDTLIISRKNYLKNRIKTNDIFHDSLNLAKKTIADSLEYDNYKKKFNEYYNSVENSSLFRINQSDMVDKSRELYYLEEFLILPMGKKYIADSIIIERFQNEVEFWIARNEYMTNKILSFAEQYNGKRIFVLTGLNHKYFFQDRLNKQQKSNIKITEIVSD
jgi:hypothetical protein